jgi:hypothetical protein
MVVQQPPTSFSLPNSALYQSSTALAGFKTAISSVFASLHPAKPQGATADKLAESVIMFEVALLSIVAKVSQDGEVSGPLLARTGD